MDKLLLSIVVVSALCAVSSAVRRYHFVNELKNMTEAQRHCREKYIDLVTIRDMEDVKTLNTTVDLSKLSCSRYRALMGLYDDMYSWRWSLSNTVGSGEPNNIERDEYCTVMYVDGKWNNYTCDLTFKPVCFDVRGPNETFVLINTSMTWTEAQSYCREHHTDLAMVRNMAENKMVKKLVLSEESWIGLYRDGWKWSDESDSKFLNWEHGVFSETRVAANFSANGQWETRKCNVMSAFICYSEVASVSKQVLKVKLKRSSSLDLNDPVVMEGLLKQLKQRLKDQGLNDDIKLSWKKQSDGKVFHEEEKN